MNSRVFSQLDTLLKVCYCLLVLMLIQQEFAVVIKYLGRRTELSQELPELVHSLFRFIVLVSSYSELDVGEDEDGV